MPKKNDHSDRMMDRREVLKLGAAASAASALGLYPLRSLGLETLEKGFPFAPPGYVVGVNLPGLRGKHFPHTEAASQAVHHAVSALAKEKDIGRAWSKFVDKEDRVGIKINTLGGRLSSTTKEVVEAIVQGVRAASVPDMNILIFDQYGGYLRGARFEIQDKPGRLRVLNHDVLGYEKNWTEVEGGRAKLCKSLTWCTAVINVPILKDHGLAGITCAMKNMVFGCVEKPSAMHRSMQTVLPHFYALDAIRGRVRLTITDGSFCLYDGGPKHNPSAHVTHDTIYATTDPVAMDVIAKEIIEDLRNKNGLRSLANAGKPVKHLELAQKLGLGIADRAKINLEMIKLPRFAAATA
jgi:uncharacterized protein (DUF362 family)